MGGQPASGGELLSVRRRGVVAAVALALALLAAPTPAPAADAPRQVDRPLHAAMGPDARFVDDLGRQVLLRGVNVNQLGEYYQDDPDVASTVPLTKGEFEAIAELGFDMVRLLITWSRVEPQPGVIDQAYLGQIRQAVEWARQSDLYVVVDMHQDAWGPAVVTPPGTTCPPGFSGNVGWDGAPAWATLTDGMSTCKIALREASPAVAQSFTNFYLDRAAPDGVGIQTHLVAAWGAVAGAVAGDPAVVGYDLINEPNPGYLFGVSDAVLIGHYYARATDAIRANGGTGMIFFEPLAYWSAATVSPGPLPALMTDDNLVFAPHLYAESIAVPGPTIEQGFTNAETVAATYGAPWFSGEWGWFGNPVDDAPLVAAYAAQEDAHLAGGAWWQWKQACGDPHGIGTPGSPTPSRSGNLVILDCPANTEAGLVGEYLPILGRAYPRAAPGRLTSLTSDPTTGLLALAGSTDETGGELDLWVPDLGLGAPVVTGTNIGPATATAVPGGWRVSAHAASGYELRSVPADSAAAAAAGAAGSAGGTDTRGLPATGATVSWWPAFALLAVLGLRTVSRRRAA